jgi:hypothetical protein
MTNRRKFIAGLGALATGSAAAVGTGAFTSVSAERTVDVAVATDQNSYLSLEPIGDRAVSDNGQLKLDFDGSSTGASGLNPDSRTAFTDLFQIRNQGENPVYVGVGTQQSDVYESTSQSNAQPHLFDYANLSGFVYAEESGSGPGLSFNGGNGNMQIDSGGRVDVSFNSNGVDDPASNPRILYAGESINVDLSIIVDGKPDLTSGSGGKRITVAAAEPNSDRDDFGSGT